MLPRQRRVTRRQFPIILQASRSWHSPVLSLRVVSGGREKPVKPTIFSFVVSKNVANKAVDRNKLKRQAQAIVRELLPKIKDNYACLLFFKKGSERLSYQKLHRAIQEIITCTPIFIS